MCIFSQYKNCDVEKCVYFHTIKTVMFSGALKLNFLPAQFQIVRATRTNLNSAENPWSENMPIQTVSLIFKLIVTQDVKHKLRLITENTLP